MFARILTRGSIGSTPTVRLVALISFFGQLYFFVPFMTPYLLERQLSIAEIASLQTMLMVSTLVMEIPTGLLADRFGHIWSFRASLIVLAGGEFLFLFARDYPTFLLIQFITGTGFALGSGSVDVILYESLPAGNRVSAMQRAKGLVGAATQMGSVVAYSIGGIIAADLTIPRMTVTIVMGAVAVTTAATLSFALRDLSDRQRIRANSRQLLGTAWSSIGHNADLRRIMLLALVSCSFSAHLLVFYQQYFLKTDVAGVWFGLALSLGSMLVVIGQYYAWKLPLLLGTKWAMVLVAGTPGVLYLAMAWNTLPVLAVLLFIMQWGAIHVSGPIFAGLFNAHLPDNARATGLSLINALLTIYIGIGGVILGWLSERSLPLTFSLIGGVILLGTALVRIDDRNAGVEQDQGSRIPSTEVKSV